jgi:glucose uptake protein
MASGALCAPGEAPSASLFKFTASQANIVGPAVSYSIGQGATMISAAWGVLVGCEFTAAPRHAKILLAWMFALFLCGLTAIAIAPVS